MLADDVVVQDPAEPFDLLQMVKDVANDQVEPVVHDQRPIDELRVPVEQEGKCAGVAACRDVWERFEQRVGVNGEVGLLHRPQVGIPPALDQLVERPPVRSRHRPQRHRGGRYGRCIHTGRAGVRGRAPGAQLQHSGHGDRGDGG